MAEINVDLNISNVVVPTESAGGASNWVAAFLSYNDLVAALGNADERAANYMLLQSPNDLFQRLYATYDTGWYIDEGEIDSDGNTLYVNRTPDGGEANWPNGPYTTSNGDPTGWGKEFDEVANYLAYGGRCFVAGRPDNLPDTVNNGKSVIENTNTTINCAYTGNPSKNEEIIDIGKTRGCMSICQVDVKAPLSSNPSPNGLPTAETEQSKNTFHVAGQKQHIGAFSSIADGDDTSTNLRTTGVAADIAGVMSNVYASSSPYRSPAGTNNRLLNFVKEEYSLTSLDRAELATKFVNPIRTFEGIGTCLFGDRTGNSVDGEKVFNYVNVSLTYSEINRRLTNVITQYMFLENNATNRSALTSSLETELRRVQAANGISEFRVICDDTNNPPDIVLAGNLIVNITFKFILSVQNIALKYTALSGDQTVQSSVGSGSASGGTSTSGGGGSSTSSGSSY